MTIGKKEDWLMGGVTTIGLTATVEFTPKQWDRYRENLGGSETPATDTEACDELMTEVKYGLFRLFDNQGIEHSSAPSVVVTYNRRLERKQ
tara:strand:+ start:324 stop:596 length:273 start_codon:yes stop_codon:yes gene_type:complete